MDFYISSMKLYILMAQNVRLCMYLINVLSVNSAQERWWNMVDLCMGFEFCTTMKIYVLIFWVYMPCNFADIRQLFWGTYCLHLSSSTLKMEALSSSETLV